MNETAIYSEIERKYMQHCKKGMRIQFCLLLFNICWAIFDLKIGLGDKSVFQLTCFGMMIMNSIWSFFFLIDNYSEYKQSKHMTLYYKEREAAINLDGMKKALEAIKDIYEKRLKEMSNGRPSEPSAPL